MLFLVTRCVCFAFNKKLQEESTQKNQPQKYILMIRFHYIHRKPEMYVMALKRKKKSKKQILSIEAQTSLRLYIRLFLNILLIVLFICSWNCRCFSPYYYLLFCFLLFFHWVFVDCLR